MSPHEYGPRHEAFMQKHRRIEDESNAADRERWKRKRHTNEEVVGTDRERLLADWNRSVGASEYAALTTDPNDPESLQRFAFAEEEQLGLSRGVFPKNETLGKNHALLMESNSRKRGEMDPNVAHRLERVIDTARQTYGDRDGWIAVTDQHRQHGLHEQEYAARVKGFAFAALDRSDAETAHLALDRAGLLTDPEVTASIERRLASLEHSDSPKDRESLERLLKVFVSRQEKAA